MRKWTLGFFAAGFVLLVAALLINGTSEGDSNEKSASAANLAPNFKLKDLDGQPVQLSDYQGKVRIVDFWATWCPPCREEIPHFIELSKTYADRDVVVIGVSLDQDGVEAVRPFVKTHGIDYPIVMGDMQTVHAYGDIRSIPTTFVIDQRGRIYKQYVGYQSKSVFEADIKALLRQGS